MSEVKKEKPASKDILSVNDAKYMLDDFKIVSAHVKSEIEKTKGKQKLNRGTINVEHVKDNMFSLESYGFKSEFLYLKEGKEDIAYTITNDKSNPLMNTFGYQVVSPDGITKKPLLAKDKKEIVMLANFINYTKKFVLENKDKLQTRQINQTSVGPFFEEDDGPGHKAVKYYSKDMFGKHTMLSGKNNFFDGGGSMNYNFNILDYSEFNVGDIIIRIHDVNSIIPFLNHIYEVQKKMQLSKLDIWRASQEKLAELKTDVETKVA